MSDDSKSRSLRRLSSSRDRAESTRDLKGSKDKEDRDKDKDKESRDKDRRLNRAESVRDTRDRDRDREKDKDRDKDKDKESSRDKDKDRDRSDKESTRDRSGSESRSRDKKSSGGGGKTLDPFDEEDVESSSALDESESRRSHRSSRKKKRHTTSLQDKSEPKTWAEVKEFEESDAWINEYADDDVDDMLADSDIKLKSVDEEDPYGLKSSRHGKLKSIQGAGPDVDITKEEFVAINCLVQVHKNTPLNELMAEKAYLQEKVYSRQEQMKVLVRDNFARFVGCKDLLDDMSSKIEGEKNAEGPIIENLELAVKDILAKAGMAFDKLLQRQDNIDTIRNVLNILKRFQFVFNLPRRMRENISKGEYSRVVLDYKKVKSLIANTSVIMFKKILNEVETIVKELREQLFKSLENPNLVLEDLEKTIRLCVDLGSPDDPAWYCILQRYKKLCAMLKDGANLPSSLLHTPLLGVRTAHASGPPSSPGSSGPSSLTAQGNKIKQYSALLQERIPDMWIIAHSFYTGAYHKNLPETKRNEIIQRYPETTFARYMSEILSLYAESISALFFSDAVKSGSKYAHTCHITALTDLCSTNSTDRLMKRLDLTGLNLNKNTNVNRMKFLIKIEEEKEKVKAVLETYKVLNAHNIPAKFMENLTRLLDQMTRQFVKHTYESAMDELSRFGKQEDWIIADEATTTTALPNKFATAVNTILVSLFGIVQPDDPLLFNLRKNFIEIANSFADCMYQLAFSAEANDEELENYYHGDSKLLMILNNSVHVKTKILPNLIKQFNTEYPGTLVENERGIFDVYDQLEKLVFDKYLKNKILVLDAHIKNGMLLSAFDPKTNSAPSSIRDYVMDLLLHLVYIHDELSRFSPNSSKSVLTTLVETIYQEFIDSLNKITAQNFSIMGLLQIGVELEFISSIVKEHHTPIATRSYNHLDVLLEYKKLKEGKTPEVPARLVDSINNVLKESLQSTKMLFECFSK